jgi:hypothetical protein
MSLSIKDYRSEAGLKKWASALGVPESPVRRRAIATSLKFFDSKMPSLPVDLAEDFLRATDTSRNVQMIQLRPKERVIAFRKAGEAEFKLFYTRPGNSKHSSGLNPRGRSAVHFQVRTSCSALESYTTGAIDTWSYPSSMCLAVRKNSTGYMASGGGLQLIIPGAHRFLDLVLNP